MRVESRDLMRRSFSAVLVLAALAAPAPAAANPNIGANDPSPIAGAPLYVDAFEQPAARAFSAALSDGRFADAANLRKIARHNIFRWIGKTDRTPSVRRATSSPRRCRPSSPARCPGSRCSTTSVSAAAGDTTAAAAEKAPDTRAGSTASLRALAPTA